MANETEIPTAEEIISRLLPPAGYEGYSVVQSRGFLVWMKPEDMGPNDSLCFYDGDCREVLKPDEVKLRLL